MQALTRLLVASFALALSACSAEAGPAAAGSGGSAGVVVGGGGSTSTGGAVSGGSGGSGPGGAGGAPIDVFYASFVAETEVGESPASVWFQNVTDFTMTLWMEQAAFVAIPAGTTAGPMLAASAAVATDTTTGKHIENACVQFAIASFSGPTELTPGKHYSMSIAFGEGVGFMGTLSESSGEPFVGLRAKILDPSMTAFRPSHLALDAPERDQVRARWVIYDDYRTPYSYAPSGKVSGRLRFVSGDDRHYAGAAPVELAGAPGYTIVVDDEPVENAALVVPLHATP